MNKNTTQALAKRADNQALSKREPTVEDFLKSVGFKKQMAMVLPKHITPERLARLALYAIRTTPKLLDCTRDSVLAAVMQSAQLGLEPGLLGHCYFIPYGRECQFIIGYKGYLDLLRRSSEIASLNVHIVYQNDKLNLVYGVEEKLTHVPWYLREDKTFEDGGDIRGCYMVTRFKSGGHHIHYMPYQDIMKKKARSASRNSSSSPWNTDYEAMIRKTVVRDAIKWLPVSIEKIDALSRDETIAHLPDSKEDFESGSYIDYVPAEQAKKETAIETQRKTFNNLCQDALGNDKNAVNDLVLQYASGKNMPDITVDEYKTMIGVLKGLVEGNNE